MVKTSRTTGSLKGTVNGFLGSSKVYSLRVLEHLELEITRRGKN